MLALELAWLTGTAFLARDPADPMPDWPPQPDRIFSALVASWGAGGEQAEERQALEWLERQPPPRLHCPAMAYPRQTVTVFVPPNDAKKERLLPELRRRQPRAFPAVALDVAMAVHLLLIWGEEPSPDHFAALQRLASRTAAIGHSASVVRAYFRRLDTPPQPLWAALRAPYRGRLAELEIAYRRHLAGDTRARPRPATRPGLRPSPPEKMRSFAAPAQWFVFEHAGGERPDLRAIAAIAEAMRYTLMEGWTRAHAAPAPAWISGHEPNGAPACSPHLAIVPLANLGWTYSDGRLMGLALIPPASETAAWSADTPDGFTRRRAFQRALAALWVREGEESVLLLTPPGGGWRWMLRPSTSGAASLNPHRYNGYNRPARIWASATPVLLDRHLKEEGVPPERSAEARAQLYQALAREHFPPPLRLELFKHAVVSGAPSARPARGNPPWLGWVRRPAFGARALVHARVEFAEPVHGPLLLGAGRFHGLGLFLPLVAETP